MYDIDVPSGQCKNGTSNAHWYQLGLGKAAACPWVSDGHTIVSHPDTGKAVAGEPIPLMAECAKLVTEAHLKLMPGVPLAGCDVEGHTVPRSPDFLADKVACSVSPATTSPGFPRVACYVSPATCRLLRVACYYQNRNRSQRLTQCAETCSAFGSPYALTHGLVMHVCHGTGGMSQTPRSTASCYWRSRQTLMGRTDACACMHVGMHIMHAHQHTCSTIHVQCLAGQPLV